MTPEQKEVEIANLKMSLTKDDEYFSTNNNTYHKILSIDDHGINLEREGFQRWETLVSSPTLVLHKKKTE